MRSKPALSLVAAFLAAASVAAQPVSVRPLPTPDASATLADVQRYYDATERNVETEYAKLVHNAKSRKQALEDRIKNIVSQIEKLKQAAKTLELVQKKMEELLPTLMATLGGDHGAARGLTPTTKRDQVAAQLRSELAALGLDVSPGDLQKIVDALGKGGSAGMALAMNIVTTLADDRAKRINDQIGTARAAINDRTSQIAALDAQIAKLEQDRQKALADLQKQREKALAEAAKAQDSRLVRIPTPTPKKP